MGYVICGPVGTGKSFLAIASPASRIPAVSLKNFRSMWQGVTRGIWSGSCSSSLR